MFHIFAKKFRFGTPHLLDFQVAAWWLARLYACFRKVAPLALPVEVFALVHCHHTPTLPSHPPPPARALARLVSSSQGMAGLAWHGMVWCGLVREPGAFIMKCGDTCRHNISKLNLRLSVKLLQLPLQGSGRALGDNLAGACSIFFQKSLVLVRHIYWIFRLLRGGWLGCTRAFVKWHLWPYPLKFSLWSTATTHPHCHCTPATPARALARLVSSSQGMAGLAWHGMVWYGLVRQPGAFIMKCGDTCRHNISKLNSGLSVKLLQLPLQGSGKALGDNLAGACSIFFQKSLVLVRHIYWIFSLLRGGWLGCTRAFVKWHLWPYPLKFLLWSTATTHPQCHCTPRHPRARSLASSRQAKAWLAWLGMVWYGMAWCESEVLSY